MKAISCLLLLTCLVAGCSGVSGGGASDVLPVTPGNYLAYHLTETARSDQKTTESDLLLTFLPDHQLGLGEEKKPVATLGADLAPVDGQPLREAELGLVYLPPAQRRDNATSRAGLVQYQKRWERWSCWLVQVREGDVSGQRYYETRTGLLVGYELNFDNPNRYKGAFRRAVLTRTDIPGLL